MNTQERLVTLELTTCCGCGMAFGLPKGFIDKRREDGASFRCPNATCPWPSQSFGDNAVKRMKRELEQAKTARDMAQNNAIRERERREATERSRAAIKGQLTKTKNRIASGACPCCEATFTDDGAHEGPAPGLCRCGGRQGMSREEQITMLKLCREMTKSDLDVLQGRLKMLDAQIYDLMHRYEIADGSIEIVG